MAKKAPKPPTGLAEVAALRVSGLTWDQVATALKRKVSTIKAWPRRYSMAWAKLLGTARRELANDITAESIRALRLLVRSEDEKISRDAATRLLQYVTIWSRKSHAKPGSRRGPFNEFQRIAAHLGSLSHEELQQLHDRCLDEPAAPNDTAGAVQTPPGSA